MSPLSEFKMKVQTLKLAALRRHPENAREKREYTKKELADLVASIREHGLLQPLVVKQDGDNYVILAGHRRHAALAVLDTEAAPCVVLEGDEQESLAVLLGENASHRTVDPIREAAAVAKLVEGFAEEKHPYERAAAVLGKSVAWVRGRMRLTALSEPWRKARADAESPIHEWPVGHLELVAALPEHVQDELLEEWTAFTSDGIPLLAELRRSLARSTCDLSKVPWDRDAAGLVDGAPACSACPSRASAQGVLFADDKHRDSCLNVTCFSAKRRATVAARIVEAREKYGDALRLETTYGVEDVPVPEGMTVHREFDLVPKAKGKGGFPVLRLRTMDVVYMAEAESRSGTSPAKPKRTGPRSMAEKRAELDKRRQIRALEVFRGSMLAREVDVGTATHPKEITPPKSSVPALLDVVALVIAYGTGPAVDSDEGGVTRMDGEPDALPRVLAIVNAKGEKAAVETRLALWSRVREPIAKSLRVNGPMSIEAVERLARQAEAVCAVCGVKWDSELLAPATAALPEPGSWISTKRNVLAANR